MSVLYLKGDLISQFSIKNNNFNLAFLFYPCGMKEIYRYIEHLNSYGIEVIAVSGGGVISSELPFIFDDMPVCILSEVYEEGLRITDLKSIEVLDGLERYSAVVFSDETVDLEELANVLKSKGVCEVLGGVAGSYINGDCDPEIFYNQEKVSHVILLFDNKFYDVIGKSVLGWKPIGIPGIITDAEGDVIYSIEDIPALEYIKKFVGEDAEYYIKQFLLALSLYKGDSEYVLAAIKSIDLKSKSLRIFHRKIELGKRVSLAIPVNINDFIREEIKAFNYDEKEESVNENSMLICVSCIGRRVYLSNIYPFLFFNITHKRKLTFSGFFSNGEYNKSAISGECRYLNLTTSTILIKAKQND